MKIIALFLMTAGLSAQARIDSRPGTICKPVIDSRVSLSISAFDRLRHPAIAEKKNAAPVPVRNEFELLGQAQLKNSAPEMYENISYVQPLTENAQPGELLVRDDSGRLHTIKTRDLSADSKSKVLQMEFRCGQIKMEKDPTPDYIGPELRQLPQQPTRIAI